MLFACCVGTLAKPVVTNGQGRRVKWDEQGIQAHDAQRGVMFGASVPLATLLPVENCACVAPEHVLAPREMAAQFADMLVAEIAVQYGDEPAYRAWRAWRGPIAKAETGSKTDVSELYN